MVPAAFSFFMTAAREIPRYKSHKVVGALKIKSVEQSPADYVADAPGGSYHITPEDAGFLPFAVGADWVEKHRPQAGGYFVSYQDGYTSFSPAAAFEEGYTAVDDLPEKTGPRGYFIGPVTTFQVRHLPAVVFPSTTPTITSLITDEKFNGAHNYIVQPMVEFNKDRGGAQYAVEPEAGIELRFVKRRDDGTWQPGLQPSSCCWCCWTVTPT
jgi:hypothetical protein